VFRGELFRLVLDSIQDRCVECRVLMQGSTPEQRDAAAAACCLGSAVESTAPVTALHLRLMRCGLIAVR
jgi:hypothetical protein